MLFVWIEERTKEICYPALFISMNLYNCFDNLSGMHVAWQEINSIP